MVPEDYSKQLLKIAKNHNGEYGTHCELDLSQEEHFKCVEYLFGGKELFKKNYPKIYKSAMLSKEYKGEKTLNANQKAGFADVIDLIDVAYDKNAERLFTYGYTSLTGHATMIYSTITVMRGEEQIGFQTEDKFVDFSVNIGVDIPNIDTEKGSDITVLLHTTWVDNNTNMLKSALLEETT